MASAFWFVVLLSALVQVAAADFDKDVVLRRRAQSECAPGCPSWYRGDNDCDSACNNYACNYDNGDCGSTTQTNFPTQYPTYRSDSGSGSSSNYDCTFCDAYCSSCNYYCQVSQYGTTSCTSSYTSIDCYNCSGSMWNYLTEHMWLMILVFVGGCIVLPCAYFGFGHCVVSGLPKDTPPTCCMRAYFPIQVAYHYDGCCSGACWMAWCLGPWYTVFCWEPRLTPRPGGQTIIFAGGAPQQVQMMNAPQQVQMMNVAPAAHANNNSSIFEVTVPQGAAPGSSFTAQVGNQTVNVTVPIGSVPGSNVQINMPAPAPQVTAVAAQAVAVSSVNVVV